MKKNIIIYLLLASVFFAGCEKNDGPVSKEIALERVPAPLIVKDASGSASIDLTNLGSFNGKINVSLYFTRDIPPLKFDIVIRKNNNNGTVKVFQAGVSSFPTTITITAAQLATLFGTPVVLNDNYDIGADVYAQSGKKYEAFPVVGLGYAAAFQPDHPGFSAVVRFSAICAYDPSIYKGNFIVVKDDWLDTNPGDIIVFTQISATQFSFIYPTAVNPIPIVVTVNPLTNTPSIAKQNIGTAWVYDPNPPAPTARTLAGPANVVAPCDKTISLNMVWGEAGSEFGPLIFSLKKQ
jgi:hypothetical protein